MSNDHRPRRPVPRHLRERVFQNAPDGICQREGCDRRLDLDTFHVSHIRAHAHGGALVEGNLEAWCSRCNLTFGAQTLRDTRLEPRDWQLRELDAIVKRIIADGAATLSAAPGAGKTVFAGLVFEALRDADMIDRMVVLAPRRALVDQWVDALKNARHIELKPHAGLERAGQHGVVSTYQSLNAEALDVHRTAAYGKRTLLVLDEVHHVGENVLGQHRRPAWARNVAELAGDVETSDLHVEGVLNLSGTLWRSAKDERISTVRYRATGDGRIQSVVDAEVTTEELVRAGQLRSIDLYRLNDRVELADMAQLEIVESNMADLDERPARATLQAMGGQAEWRENFVRAILDRLEQAHRSLNGHHVKALIVAARQEHARAFQAEVNRQMVERGLRPLAEVATSDEEDAERVLEDFRRQQRVGVLCTVDMAGEGYDCPDIAVVGYASNKLTTLYVRQVVARAMRVTDKERELGLVIPAALVIPDVPILVETLVEYLAPFTHEILLPDEERGDYRQRHRDEPEMLPQARYILEAISPDLETVTVAGGEGEPATFNADIVARLAQALERVQVPGVFAPRVLQASGVTVGDLLNERPFDELHGDAVALQRMAGPRSDDSIETKAKLLQSKAHRLEGWWAKNGATSIPVARFAAAANRAAGIAGGGRDNATPDQLQTAVDYERQVIARHCNEQGINAPRI